LGIDPRINDLRSNSQAGTGTGATTPDIIDRPEGEIPEGEEEAEEPEGKKNAGKFLYLYTKVFLTGSEAGGEADEPVEEEQRS
jgi:hypothetical protein